MADEPFRFSTVVEVRWRDVDALGHVNNAVYFTYLEQTRVHYFRAFDLVPDDPMEIGFILAEACCQFKAPLKLGERVTIWARISEMGRSSFTMAYRVEGEDGRLAALARSVQVCYDYQAQQSVPIPARWRETVLEYEPGLGE